MSGTPVCAMHPEKPMLQVIQKATQWHAERREWVCIHIDHIGDKR